MSRFLLGIVLTLIWASITNCAFLHTEDTARQNRFLWEPQKTDIQLGMRMEDVQSTWGEPQDVETAGKPSQGYQRWIYPDSSFAGQTGGKKRVLYFEGGQVVGWETQTH